MSIRMLESIHVAGSSVARGAVLSLTAALEADLVAQNKAAYVDKPLEASEGLVPALWTPDGTGLKGPDGSVIKYHKSLPAPKMLRMMDNPLGSLALYHPVYAVGVGSKVYAVAGVGAAAGYSFVYDWTTGTLDQSAIQFCGGAITAGTVEGIYASTHGLFASVKKTAETYRRMYKATYAAPNTWVEVFHFGSLANPEPTGDYECKHYAECDNGNLFLAAYNSALVTGTSYTQGALKSTDGGDTWSEISASLPFSGYRHIHSFVWDKYRKLLWLCVGDEGDKPSVAVSDDYGATWSVLGSSMQCGAVCPTPNGILYLSDRQVAGNDEVNIWLLDGLTKSELLVNSPVVVFNPLKDGGLGATNTNQVGAAWFGYYDDNHGVVYVPYINTAGVSGEAGKYTGLYASSDGGYTWDVVCAEYVDSTTSSFHRQEHSSRPNDYVDWDGWQWRAGANTRIAPWLVHSADAALVVANASGLPNGNGSVAKPFKRIPHVVREHKNDRTSLFHVPHRFKLTENYSEQLHLSTTGAIVDRNGYSFTGAGIGALTVDEAFTVNVDSPPANWAEVETTGLVTWNSTAQAHSGSYSVKCLVAASAATSSVAVLQRNLSAAVDGDVLTAEAWVYVDIPAATFTTGSFVLFKFHGTLSIRLNGSTVDTQYLSIEEGSLGIAAYQRAGNTKTFPLRQWVKVTIRMRHSYNSGAEPYSGAVELWQDGEKIISIPGGMRTSNRASSTLIYFGIQSRSSAFAFDIPVYIDDVKILSNSIPDQSAELVMAGVAQVLI